MNTLLRLVLVGLASTIAGCGSGGSGPAQPPPPPPTSPLPPPPPANENPAFVSCADQPSAAQPSLAGLAVSAGGIWTGTLTNESRQTTRIFEALIGENGQFHFFAFDSAAKTASSQMAGNLTSTGNTLAGTGRAYLAPGDAAFDSGYSGDVEITGVVVAQTRFTAQWTAASGDSGCIDATSYYLDDYGQIGVPAGTWTAFQAPSLVLTIDPDGRFTGQGGDGCTVNGLMAPIDARYALFEVGVEISGCATAGDYTGISYVCWSCGTAEPNLIIMIDNGARAIRRFLS